MPDKIGKTTRKHSHSTPGHAKRLVKRTTFAAARYLGVNSCVRTALRHRLLALCYHGVIPDSSPADSYRTRNATRLSDFAGQMKILRRLFTPVSATDVLHHIETGAPLPPYPAMVTFDDGLRNNLTFAAPELERFEIPALILVSSDHITKGQLLWPQELDERIANWKHATLPMPQAQKDTELPGDTEARWQVADRVRAACKRLPHEERMTYLDRLRQEPLLMMEDWQQDLYSFLSWEEVRQLDGRGFSIGSHTVSHPILTTLTPSRLACELGDSKTHIERELGKPCPWFAYPNGGKDDFSPEVVEATRTAGYKMAFTLLGQNNSRSLNPLTIDRVCITGDLTENEFAARMHGFWSLLSE